MIRFLFVVRTGLPTTNSALAQFAADGQSLAVGRFGYGHVIGLAAGDDLAEKLAEGRFRARGVCGAVEAPTDGQNSGLLDSSPSIVRPTAS